MKLLHGGELRVEGDNQMIIRNNNSKVTITKEGVKIEANKIKTKENE